MMNALISLGLGIIVFALIAGIGVVILYNFGGAQAGCKATTCGSAGVWNRTTNVCSNATDSSCGTPTGTAFTNNTTLIGYLNTNLITWVPAVIALGIGLLFIGSLMGGKTKF
jgi:hypothetical protein